MTSARLLLASGSPSRLRILRSAGIEPLVCAPDVDERALEAAHPHASVGELAALLAEAKADAVAARLDDPDSAIAAAADADRLVLVASDSVLELDGAPVGKPHTAERTRTLWAQMAGTSPELRSSHCTVLLERAGSGWEQRARRTEVASTRVHLASPDPEELEAYIATREPFEVAGALTIDGLGGPFVTGIEGDHHNVIGLSLPLLRTMLAELGIRWTDLWNRPGALG